MKIKSRIKETDFTFCDQLIFKKKEISRDLKETTVLFESNEYGSIVENRVDAGSFLISFLEFDLIKPVNFEFQNDEPLMQMNFFIKGFDNSMVHNIRRIDNGINNYKIPVTQNTFKCISIFFQKHSFDSLLDFMFWDNKNDFPEIAPAETPADFIKQSLSMSLEIQSVIGDICSCDKKKHFKRIYIETKVTELLLLQLEQYENKEVIQNKFSRSDIEKMNEARNLIVENLTTPCSLIDLAKKVGTNEFKLKKQFKELFGTTVFGYLNEIKMGKAQEMLQQGNLNVTQVSEELGYKTNSHFITVFKRHFGYSPGSVLKVSLTMMVNIFDVMLQLFTEDVVALSMI